MPNFWTNGVYSSQWHSDLTLLYKNCSEKLGRARQVFAILTSLHSVLVFAAVDRPCLPGLGMDFLFSALSASLYCYKKIPQTKWLKQQKCVSHSSGGREVQGQCAGQFCSLQGTSSWLCPHMLKREGGK